jgi:GT2 family glycosyltransferase
MNSPPIADRTLSASVVLHHNPIPQLHKTLESLELAASYASRGGLLAGLKVTLVDNSCDPGYGQLVQTLLRRKTGQGTIRFEYLPQDENRGYGAGHNVALLTSDSDLHLVLNPDVELEESTLQVGLARLEEGADIALLSPRVSGDGGNQEFLCKRYPSVLVLVLRAFAPAFVQAWFRKRLDRYQMVDLCGGEQAVDVPLASGCFMLAPTRELQAVGGFDERYFLYFEDFDLSLRLGERGRLVFEPAMRIVHHGGYAARKGLRHVSYFLRSGIRFFNDHGWRWI